MSQQTHEAEVEHPTAEQELEQLADNQAELEKERRRLQRGEVALPWPYTTKAVAVVGILSLLTAGGLIVVNNAEGALALAGIVTGVAGFTLLVLSRWLHRHFEIEPRPRYAPIRGHND